MMEVSPASQINSKTAIYRPNQNLSVALAKHGVATASIATPLFHPEIPSSSSSSCSSPSPAAASDEEQPHGQEQPCRKPKRSFPAAAGDEPQQWRPKRYFPNMASDHNEFLSETVLVLVAKTTNWNPFLLCVLPCVCKKMEAIVKRVLWREFCLSRAPKMLPDLLEGVRNGHIEGGWHALAKLLLYCAGDCRHTKSKRQRRRNVQGHFVHKTRFSRTSGKSFLVPECRRDVLYVTDPCEHVVEVEPEREEAAESTCNGAEDEGDDDVEEVGLFRGVFRSFSQSDTRRLLVQRSARLDPSASCPFCRARGWQMAAARMVPPSAALRLAAYNDEVDFFVCLNGHMNGSCALLPLSDDDADADAD